MFENMTGTNQHSFNYLLYGEHSTGDSKVYSFSVVVHVIVLEAGQLLTLEI
jgi:hypothetical protein